MKLLITDNNSHCMKEKIILEPNGCVSLALPNGRQNRIGVAWEYHYSTNLYTARVLNEPCVVVASNLSTLRELVTEYVQGIINRQ